MDRCQSKKKKDLSSPPLRTGPDAIQKVESSRDGQERGKSIEAQGPLAQFRLNKKTFVDIKLL